MSDYDRPERPYPEKMEAEPRMSLAEVVNMLTSARSEHEKALASVMERLDRAEIAIGELRSEVGMP